MSVITDNINLLGRIYDVNGNNIAKMNGELNDIHMVSTNLSMNLLTQALENIYEFGNVTLHLDRFSSKIIFTVGEGNKLDIKTETTFDCFNDTYDLSLEEAIPHIASLVYYSFVSTARKNDKVYLTSNIDQKQKPEITIAAVNELYHQLIPMLSIQRKNIESIVKSDIKYDVFANLANYVDNSCDMLNIKAIMEEIVKKYDKFEKVLGTAWALWRAIGNGDVKTANEAFNRWNNYLNILYIIQFDDPEKIDLNNLDLDYEILTNKKYSTNPAINCEENIEELEIALLTPSKSALLVGPPGVGKTAIVEGLAYRINKNQVPKALKNKQILKINVSSLVRGCSLVGEFEKKVENLMKYLYQNPDTILFIDELHTAIGAGAGSKGNLDLANILKPHLERGYVKIIGATTNEEYEQHIQKDKAFERRLQKISVLEPKKNAVYEIIKSNIEKLEKTTGVKWDFDFATSRILITHIIECTDEKHRIYDSKKYNPDISITILENSFARAIFAENERVNIINITDAIRKCDYLYQSVRNYYAGQLLSIFQDDISEEQVNPSLVNTTKIKLKRYNKSDDQFN